jgi:hypothetical protein
MTRTEAGNHQSSHNLTDVLHHMVMKSRSRHSKSPAGRRAVNKFSMQNSLPNGDPPEVTMWGGA